MKTIRLLPIFALFANFLLISPASGQTTYTWIGTAGASWATSTNWSPTRTSPATNDIIQFSGGGSKSATSVPTETIGQLQITGSTSVSLTSGGSPAKTLSVGVTLNVASGSSLSLISGGPTFTLNYTGTGATGSIAGTLTVNMSTEWNTTTGITPSSTVSGTVVNNSATITGSISTLTFVSGGKYQHNYTSDGTIPTATWNAASICEIIGNTNNSNAPLGLNQTFGNFEWNCTSQSGSSVNFGGNLTSVAGNFKIVSTGSSSVALNSNGPWTITISGDLIIQSGTLDAQAANKETIINLGGSFNQTGGTFTTSGTSPTVTFNFTGSGKTFTQSGGTITNTFFDWSVNSGAILTLNNNLPVASGRTLTVAGRLNCGSNAVTGAGIFTLNSAATLGIGSTAGITSTAGTGNIRVTGTRSYNAGANYVYNGTSGAQVTGNQLPATISSLTTDNTAGVTLSQAVAISGSAIFTNGVLSTTATNLLTINSGASVSGASNSSFVDGPMAKVGSTAFTFPVGKIGTGYQPCGISTISASTTFTAQYFRGVPPNNTSLNAPIAAISYCEYWNIRASSSLAVYITLYWNSNSGCGSGAYIPGNYPYPALRIVRHRPSTSDWINASNFNSQDPASTSSNGNMTTELSSGSFTTPNYFTFGTTDASQIPLPVKFGSIKAYEKQKGVQIEWNTYSEKNVDHFEIQRSSDGRSFYTIGQVAANNLESRSDYSWYDANPLLSNNFYRIKSVDIDSKSDFTSIVKITLGKNNSGISIYPNPVIGKQVSFQVADIPKGIYTWIVYSNTGQQVYRHATAHEGGAFSQTLLLPATLPSGVYNLNIKSGETRISKAFIIQ